MAPTQTTVTLQKLTVHCLALRRTMSNSVKRKAQKKQKCQPYIESATIKYQVTTRRGDSKRQSANERPAIAQVVIASPKRAETRKRIPARWMTEAQTVQSRVCCKRSNQASIVFVDCVYLAESQIAAKWHLILADDWPVLVLT